MKKAMKGILYFLLSLVVIIAAAGALSRDRAGIPAGFTGSYITVEGERIRFLQKGTGRNVLLIHGLPGSIEDWSPVFDRLSSRYRVTAYDRPGHGFSSAKETDYTLGFNAKLALGIIRELKLKKVIVVGHSYGGGIALTMAVENPPETAAFISIAGVSYPMAGGDPLYRLIRIPLFGRGLAVLTPEGIGRGMVKEGELQAFHPNESAMPANFMSIHEVVFLQPKVMVSLAREEGTMNDDLAGIMPRFGKISAPLIILHGTGDMLVPFRDSEKLHKAVTHSRLVRFGNTGHMVQFVHPDGVIRAVNDAAGR